MNFFAHAAVAADLDPDPRFVLGSMLPDLASMGRVKLGAVADAWVARGVDCHHRTDAVFHRADWFRTMCRDGERALEAAGVGRGPAAAVAHVGIEMLLDGLLLEQEAAAEAYRSAIALDDDFGIELRRGNPLGVRRVLGKLREIGLPDDYRSPERVAMRLEQILRSRPRLAFGPGDEARVVPWLDATRDALAPQAERRLREVTDAVRVG